MDNPVCKYRGLMHEPHKSVWDQTNENHADKLVDSVTDLQHNVYNVKCITLGSYQLNI